MIVYVPKERILATGDLVVSPISFGIQSYYADCIETLGKLQKIDAQTLFLGHGKAQHDWQYVGTLQNLLTDSVTRVTAEIKKGSTLEEIKENGDVGGLEEQARWRQRRPRPRVRRLLRPASGRSVSIIR